MKLLNFRTNLYARPDSLVPSDSIVLRDVELRTYRGTGLQTIFDAYFPLTFEQALAALQTLPRMDAEPDGFFVYSGEAEGQRWQIDGHLFDFNNQLHRVELSGNCPETEFYDLLMHFAADKTLFVFELIREGVVLDERNFRLWASAG